jgi:hypothetical protein
VEQEVFTVPEHLSLPMDFYGVIVAIFALLIIDRFFSPHV